MSVYKAGPMQLETVANNSGSAISVGDDLEDDASNGVQALTNGGNLFGVAHEDIADGDTGAMEVPLGAIYEVDLATGFDPNRNDAIYAAGSNTFDDGTGHAAALACGYIVNTNPASGSALAQAMLFGSWVNTAAHG